MARTSYIRTRFIPAGSTKVADKVTSAVAYIYTTSSGHPAACAYAPKAIKPALHCRYRSPEAREKAVAAFFAGYRAKAERVAKDRAEAAALEHDYKVGEVLSASWGYDQTNIEWFEIVATTRKTVTFRKIAAHSVETLSMQGKCAPKPGEFVGPAKVARPDRYGVRVHSCATARRAPFKEVAGVKVYDSAHWTAYA